MSDKKVVAAGKSQYEVTFELMNKLLFAADGPEHEATRNDILKHYSAARSAVWGTGDTKF